jgi:hypothetical protein
MSSLSQPIDPATLDDPKYDEMTPTLKEKIRVADDPNYVWVDCRGRNPADREALRYESKDDRVVRIQSPYF